jgi:adenine deaminase
LIKYFGLGISKDYDCTGYDEAVGKINFGMKILIRDGTAILNFNALVILLEEFPEKLMIC